MKTSRFYLLENHTYCSSKFYIAWIGNFAVLLLWPWAWQRNLIICLLHTAVSSCSLHSSFSFRWGGNFFIREWKISSPIQQCKNYKNRSRFSKVMITNILPPFLWFTVYIHTYLDRQTDIYTDICCRNYYHAKLAGGKNSYIGWRG